jgi:glycosyltransferase involved in cell wall biosynthesis
LRLLFILPEYRKEPAGGIRTFYCNLLPALAKAGCRVKVLVVHRGMFDAPPFTDEGGVEVEYLRSAIFEKHSRSVAASYMDGYPALGHFVPMGLAAYEQAEAGEGYDLVELTDWPLYFLPWVCRGSKAPFTISLHSSIGQMRFYGQPRGGEMETQFIRLLEAAAFSAAASVHTNSNLNARYWEGITNRKVDVLLPMLRPENPTTENTGSTEVEAGWRLAGQSVDSESASLPSKFVDSSVSESITRSGSGPASSPASSYSPTVTKPEVPLLNSGRSTLDSAPRLRGAVFARLQNWKGAEVLCEALRLVPEVSVEWYGRTVTGTDGKRSYAEELEEKFPDIFGNQLLHIGEVSREEASRAMRSVDFVCVPSLWDVFNLTVVEAMQQGAVVICSRQAGAEMLVADGRNAFLFDPSSPKNLVELLRHIAGLSIERREEIGNAAKQTILENLDLASLTEARMCFYRSILDASPSPAASSFLKSLCNFPESPIRKRRTIRSKVANILQRLPVFQARGGN